MQTFMTNKLVMACQGVPACRIAVSNPGEDLSQLISKLQSSIIAWEKENPNQGTLGTYFTDRRYHNSRNRSNMASRPTFEKRKGQCYICHKEDCRSWKHTHQEQQQAKERYRDRFNKKTSGQYTKRFEERFKQYITDCAEDDTNGSNDDEDDFDEIFETLVADVRDELPIQKNPSPLPTTYLTSFGDLNEKEATLTYMELTNKAFCHQLTATDTTNTTATLLDMDPFIYKSAPDYKS